MIRDARRVHVRWVFGMLAAAALALALRYAAAAQQPPEVADAPADLSWQASIAGPDEPGERMVISGRVLAPDGETPVAGIIVYGYHTDATGHYTKTAVAGPPRLRGWAKTNADGRFEFRTIRPAAYPGRNIPAHVHFQLWGAGYPRQWVDDLRFEGDPLVTSSMLREAAAAGRFAAVRPLDRGTDGTLHCTVNLRVQRVSNFKN